MLLGKLRAVSVYVLDTWIQPLSATLFPVRFRGSSVVEALPRTMIEATFNRTEILVCDRSEIRFLRQGPPNESDRVLHRALLPAVERGAEVRSCPEDGIGLFVVRVLTAVVIRDDPAEMRWTTTQPSGECDPHLMRASPLELREFGEAGLPFGRHLERGLALPRDGRIGFPVSRNLPPHGLPGALHDGNTAWNVDFLVLPTVPAAQTFLVSAYEEWDEDALRCVDPLVHGLMRDGLLGVEDAPATGGELR